MGDVIKLAKKNESFDPVVFNLEQICVGLFTPMITKMKRHKTD